MNRLLTLTSGGLFATSLAILPISAFAQQNTPDGKTAAPMTQMGNTDSKAPATAVTPAPAMKPMAVGKTVKTHHVKPMATPANASTSAVKHANPVPTAAGTQVPATTPVQPTTVDHSKS